MNRKGAESFVGVTKELQPLTEAQDTDDGGRRETLEATDHSTAPQETSGQYRIDRLVQAFYTHDIQPFDTRLGNIGRRGDGTAYAVLGCLAQPVGTVRNRPDLTGKSHLAEGRQVPGQGAVTVAGEHRQQHRQVGGRLRDAHAPHDIYEHIPVEHGDPAVPVQHRQQHGKAVLIQAQGHPPRIREGTLIHQGLHLHHEGPRAFSGHHHQAARHGLPVARQEDGRGVRHFPQPPVRHGEDAELVDGAEAVLDRPDQAQGAFGFPLEIEHRVHHMLQHPGTGQRTLLGHMPHQEDRGIHLLGKAHQLRRRIPHLRHGPRRRLQQLRMQGLYGVHDQDPRSFRCGRSQHALDAGLRQEAHPLAHQPEPPRPQADLLGRLLTRDIEHRVPLPQGGTGLEQQGGLTDPRIAADEHHRALDQPAPEHPVELGDTTAQARVLLGTDGGEQDRLGPAAGDPGISEASTRRRRLRDLLHQIPGPAVRALPAPLG